MIVICHCFIYKKIYIFNSCIVVLFEDLDVLLSLKMLYLFSKL